MKWRGSHAQINWRLMPGGALAPGRVTNDKSKGRGTGKGKSLVL